MARRTFEVIVAVIGPEAAERLVSSRGGVRIYVPVAVRDGWLVDLLGPVAAGKLCRTFGGEVLSVPAARDSRHEILALREQGHSAADIARHLHITERRVYQILAQRAEPNDC